MAGSLKEGAFGWMRQIRWFDIVRLFIINF